ncbi:MAG: hypothetical protein ACK4P3_09695 [Fimbriimonadaceae bacterium]
MTWEESIEERNPMYPDVEAVVLQHEHVDCYLVIRQPGLLTHLKESERREIPVEFVLVSGIGGWRTGLAWYSISRIDTIPHRAHAAGGHGGCRGIESQDPFREFYSR